MAIALNRSRQVRAEDSASFGTIAERFRRAGDLQRAVNLCEEGLQKYPEHLSARVTLGWALLDLGRHREARTHLEDALRRAPDNLAAIRGLAHLHDQTNESDGYSEMDAANVWPPIDVEPAHDERIAPPAGRANGLHAVERFEPVEDDHDAAMHRFDEGSDAFGIALSADDLNSSAHIDPMLAEFVEPARTSQPFALVSHEPAEPTAPVLETTSMAEAAELVDAGAVVDSPVDPPFTHFEAAPVEAFAPHEALPVAEPEPIAPVVPIATIDSVVETAAPAPTAVQTELAPAARVSTDLSARPKNSKKRNGVRTATTESNVDTSTPDTQARAGRSEVLEVVEAVMPPSRRDPSTRRGHRSAPVTPLAALERFLRRVEALNPNVPLDARVH